MPFPVEKRHRLPRECYRGRVTVSFTACVEGRRTPFHDAETVKLFVGKLTAALAKWHCVALIYCFMPDHLHVVIQGRDDRADTWRAMVDFKQQTEGGKRGRSY
jgi:REP element-mobilizing transposase RayT